MQLVFKPAAQFVLERISPNFNVRRLTIGINDNNNENTGRVYDMECVYVTIKLTVEKEFRLLTGQ